MTDKYQGGCIFVDHASEYVHVELQVRLNTHETLHAKEEFVLSDHMDKDEGIVPATVWADPEHTKHYHNFLTNLRYDFQLPEQVPEDEQGNLSDFIKEIV